MDYRHEVKHIITAGDAAAIRTNLSAVAHLDPHAKENGYYRIRSLYFDDPMDTALHEKLDGVNERRISGRRIILRGRIQHRYLDLDRSMRRRIADSGPAGKGSFLIPCGGAHTVGVTPFRAVP